MWERIVEQAGEREKEGLEVTLQTVSDGTMMGRGVMTKGAGAWVIPNPWTEEYKEFWEVVAGDSQVHEDPRWISSARAELMGLLSVTMFLVTRGWEYDVVHSLDSQAVVKRGSKVKKGMIVTREAEGSNKEWKLEDWLRSCDPDLWSEWRAWRKRLKGTMTLRWERGHPERRKAPRRTWSKHMIAIFIADAVAEEIRTSGREVKTRVEWQN